VIPVHLVERSCEPHSIGGLLRIDQREHSSNIKRVKLLALCNPRLVISVLVPPRSSSRAHAAVALISGTCGNLCWQS